MNINKSQWLQKLSYVFPSVRPSSKGLIFKIFWTER